MCGLLVSDVTVFINPARYIYIYMWFTGVEVEQETSAPPPKKNPGSAPAI